MLYLSKLESKLDEALSKETRESLTEWIGHKRKKPLNQNKMKQYKKNYGGVEDDYSERALFVFFLIGMVIISTTSYLLFNL